jgi:hypothetical protein
MTRWFRDRGRCQIELTLLDVFLVRIVFLDAFDFRFRMLLDFLSLETLQMDVAVLD